MRKIRLLALFSLFLCAVMVLTSCGIGGSKNGNIKALSFKDVVKKSTAEEPATAQIEKLTLEGTVVRSNDVFVVLLKDGVSQTVYNMVQNKVVFTNTNTALLAATTINIYDPDDRTAYFTVYVNDTTGTETREQTTLYDASGNTIATLDRLANPTRTFDLVSFGNKIYRLGDTSATATLTELTGYSALNGDIPDIGAASADYYYEFNYGGGKNVHVYDKNLKLVSAYNVEGNPTGVANMILENGNVVFQMTYRMPNDTEDYTYFNGTNKIKMETVIVNAKNGKAKEISFDYQLMFGSSFGIDIGSGLDEDDGFLAKKIRSIAILCPIKDRVLMSNSTDPIVVAVDNSMKILGRLDRMYDNQIGVIDNTYPSYFTVGLANNGALLINEKGKVIGDISGADELTYSYIYAGGKLYNYNLEAVYDYEAAGYEVEEALEHSAILSKDNNGTDEYFIYTNGELKALDTKDDKLTFVGADSDLGVYIVQDTTDLLNKVNRYYNDKGELIFTQNGEDFLALVCDNDDGVALYSFVDPETTQLVYYRVTY